MNRDTHTEGQTEHPRGSKHQASNTSKKVKAYSSKGKTPHRKKKQPKKDKEVKRIQNEPVYVPKNEGSCTTKQETKLSNKAPLTETHLKQTIIWTEVLGEPVSRKRRKRTTRSSF